ncbi:MAG: 30S ribosomal protein S17 [Verrucomicrobiota bacterium]
MSDEEKNEETAAAAEAPVEETPAAAPVEEEAPVAEAKADTAPAEEAEASEKKPGLRKERVGKVVSDKMKQTIVVEVVRRVPHPKFRKIIKRSSKFYAHDEDETAVVGDKVRIVECRPLSKTKRWRLAKVLAH